MSKKSQRLRSARDRLVQLASDGELLCTKHNTILRPYQVYNAHCYTRKGRAKDCKYLRRRE